MGGGLEDGEGPTGNREEAPRRVGHPKDREEDLSGKFHSTRGGGGSHRRPGGGPKTSGGRGAGELACDAKQQKSGIRESLTTQEGTQNGRGGASGENH